MGPMVASRGQVRVERLAAEIGWSASVRGPGSDPRSASLPNGSPSSSVLIPLSASSPWVTAPPKDAVESGYVDQSHLHREVMAFAGVTPAALAVAPFLAVDDVAWT
jgi:hypothetical protein